MLKVKYFFIIATILTTFSVNAQKSKDRIHFRNISLEKAISLVQKEGKVLFVKFYNPYDSEESEDDSKNKEVASYFNENFINIRVDLRWIERDFEFTYKITRPTVLFLNEIGDVLARGNAYQSPEDLLKLAKKALDPEKNMYVLNQKYLQGLVDYDIILNQLEQNYNDSLRLKLLNQYFSSIDPSRWMDKNSWQLIKDYATVPSPYFKYLITNEDTFKRMYGKIPVDQVILGKFIKHYMKFRILKKGVNEEESLKSLDHPFYARAILLVTNNKNIVYLSENPVSLSLWKEFFSTTDQLINTWGKVEKVSLRTMGYMVINNENYKLPKIIEVINATNHPLAPTMIEYIKFAQTIDLLSKKKLSSRDQTKINQKAEEILSNRVINLGDLNDIAMSIVKHPNRISLLNLAKKLSAITLEEKKSYHYDTYGTICAQMKDFKEAIKYEQIAIDLSQKDDPERAETYLNNISRFTREETLFE